MAESSSINEAEVLKMAPPMRKKWLQSEIQIKKSTLFGHNQQIEKYKQEIEDIREGKINKVKYSMLATLDQLQQYEKLLEVVDRKEIEVDLT